MGTRQAGRRDDLAQLKKRERILSTRRTRLQDRLDFLRAGGAGPVEQVADLIAQLEAQERDVSARRRELHERIERALAALRHSR